MDCTSLAAKVAIANGGEYRISPDADLFPMMDDESFAELVNDIRENGQHEPIVFWRGTLIDGRNRLKACRQLGIEPDTCEIDDDVDPLHWVVSANLHRRHLTQSQRAMVAAKLLPLYEEEAKFRMLAGKAKERMLADRVESLAGKPDDPTAEMPEGSSKGESREKVAALVGVSPRLVSDAKAILKTSPEVAAQVERGEKSIGKAKSEAKVKELPKPIEKPAKAKPAVKEDYSHLVRLWPSFAFDADDQDDDLRLCMMIAGPNVTAFVTAEANDCTDTGCEWGIHPMLLGFTKIIHDRSPELFKAMHDGRMTIQQALARLYFLSRFDDRDDDDDEEGSR